MARGVKGSGYVDNEELLREIVASKAADELTPRAAQMLIAICENANRRLKYRDPQDREDCVAFGILEVFRYWRGFKPERGSNPFAYYTQCAKNGYAKGWSILHPVKTRGTVSMDRSNDGEGMHSI
mgnify:CR=1 FL=1